MPPLHARQTFTLPPEVEAAFREALADWQKAGKTRRLWARDASLWTGDKESASLGWLGVSVEQLALLDHLTAFAQEIIGENYDHILLLGMGGSSLCPDVLRRTLGRQEGFPELLVLDSTDPAQIATIEARITPEKTLFIVSSKSGGTLEPNIFKQYFYTLAKKALGAKEVGQHFIAITDPGSDLEKVAEADGFRRIFHGLTSIGGRYSALSDFGMVPAALMGLDVKRFLEYTGEMVHACEPCVPDAQNPGVSLGVLLGTLATQFGRDKVTLVASPEIEGVGGWLEQLLAESTGKDGRGLVPVDNEPLGPPEVYGHDRVFAYLRLEPAPDAEQERALAALEAAGQPVVRIALLNAYDLGQQFFGWEIATAAAGSLLGINAFNQPDVEASKIATKKLTAQYEKKGHLPPETPFLKVQGVALFADDKNTAALQQSDETAKSPTLADTLRAHLDRVGAGDYFALLAYVEMNDAHLAALQGIRTRIRDTKRVATCLGFGPRFLHSTGQPYKGGPSLTLPREVAEKVIARIGEEGLDVWVYAGLGWYLRDPNAPHREKEEHTVQFPPTVVKDFSAALEAGVAKIVGVSDDLELVARVEKMSQAEFAGAMCTKQSNASREHDSAAPQVSAARSQPYYLDVTHPKANKGGVVEMLVRTQNIPADQIATLGDQPNDILMFEKSGFAIAMGQANEQVKNSAARVTTGLDDEGFARAVEEFILGDA